jgi:hypothetical protein
VRRFHAPGKILRHQSGQPRFLIEQPSDDFQLARVRVIRRQPAQSKLLSLAHLDPPLFVCTWFLDSSKLHIEKNREHPGAPSHLPASSYAFPDPH